MTIDSAHEQSQSIEYHLFEIAIFFPRFSLTVHFLLERSRQKNRDHCQEKGLKMVPNVTRWLTAISSR